MHRRGVAPGNVGGIGDNDVERPGEALRQIVERIGAAQLDGRFEAAAVLGRHGQRLVGDVGRRHLGAGKPPLEGDGDAAAARPHVEQPAGRRVLTCDPLHQLLGFGAGDEHPLAHLEAHAAELRLAQLVLHGASRRKPCDDVVEPLKLELRPGVGQQLRAAHAAQPGGREQCDAARLVVPVEGGERLGDAADDIVAGGHGWSRSARMMASAASTTTAPLNAMQRSWRPPMRSARRVPVAGS